MVILIPSRGQKTGPSLGVRLTYTPEYVLIDGKPTVYYELRLTNSSKDTIDLKSAEVLDNADSSLLFFINNEELMKRHSITGARQKDKKNILCPGFSSVLYFEYSIAHNKPDLQLTHRLKYVKYHEKESRLMVVTGGVTSLSKNPRPVVLGPPLTKGIWAAVYHPSWTSGHRRVVYTDTLNGKAYIPGRFAIDFIKLDTRGRYAGGDQNLIENWYGYGNEVLAVADGIVVSTRNDFPENHALSDQLNVSPYKASGNFISIGLENKTFAFYEHLKPGSIRVKPGQKVKKGEVIASVGFTGQSTGPHLHFHLASQNNTLYAEGIPFVFDHFLVLGSYVNFEDFGKTIWKPAARQPTTVKEHPAPNSVIRF
jgi:murein DD-endopeptidase